MRDKFCISCSLLGIAIFLFFFLSLFSSCLAQDYPKIFVEKLTENRFIIRNDSVLIIEQKEKGIPLDSLDAKEKKEMNTIYQYDLENKQRDRIRYMRHLKRTLYGAPWTPPVYHGYFVIRNDKISIINEDKFYWVDSTRGSITQAQGQYWSLFEFRMAEADTGYIGQAYRNPAPNRIYWLVIWPWNGAYPYNTGDELRVYLNDPNSVPRWTESP